MFSDGAWIFWGILAGMIALLGGTGLVLVWKACRRPKPVKFTSPKGQDWGTVTGFFTQGRHFSFNCDGSVREDPPGPYEEDCTVYRKMHIDAGIPPAPNGIKLFFDSTRVRHFHWLDFTAGYRRKFIYAYFTGSYIHQMVKANEADSIERGVETGTPLTLKKQKGPSIFVIDDPGPYPTKEQQRIAQRASQRIARKRMHERLEGKTAHQVFDMLYRQRPYEGNEDTRAIARARGEPWVDYKRRHQPYDPEPTTNKYPDWAAWAKRQIERYPGQYAPCSYGEREFKMLYQQRPYKEESHDAKTPRH